MTRKAMMLAMLASMLTACGLVEDCPGMPSGATCCDGTHYCEAGKTCNNSNGTCVSGGAPSGTCSQEGADAYFSANCHKTTNGIEFVGAPWPQHCGTCPSDTTTTNGTDNVTANGPYWMCVCK